MTLATLNNPEATADRLTALSRLSRPARDVREAIQRLGGEGTTAAVTTASGYSPAYTWRLLTEMEALGLVRRGQRRFSGGRPADVWETA